MLWAISARHLGFRVAACSSITVTHDRKTLQAPGLLDGDADAFFRAAVLDMEGHALYRTAAALQHNLG